MEKLLDEAHKFDDLHGISQDLARYQTAYEQCAAAWKDLQAMRKDGQTNTGRIYAGQAASKLNALIMQMGEMLERLGRMN